MAEKRDVRYVLDRVEKKTFSNVSHFREFFRQRTLTYDQTKLLETFMRNEMLVGIVNEFPHFLQDDYNLEDSGEVEVGTGDEDEGEGEGGLESLQDGGSTLGPAEADLLEHGIH